MYLCETKNVALMSHPLGFLRLPLKISLYNSMLLLLMASSKVIVIIWGTSFGGRSLGVAVPSSEQKQSGRTQTAGSQGGARFGSLSLSKIREIKTFDIKTELPESRQGGREAFAENYLPLNKNILSGMAEYWGSL